MSNEALFFWGIILIAVAYVFFRAWIFFLDEWAWIGSWYVFPPISFVCAMTGVYFQMTLILRGLGLPVEIGY